MYDKTKTPDLDQIVDTKDLERLTGFTRRFWEVRRISGDTPPYIKLSARAVRYRWGDVVDWLDSKKCTGTKDGNNKTNQDIREVEK